jgi:hypothetical protein
MSGRGGKTLIAAVVKFNYYRWFHKVGGRVGEVQSRVSGRGRGVGWGVGRGGMDAGGGGKLGRGGVGGWVGG